MAQESLPGSWALIVQAWRLYRNRFELLIGITALPALITLIIGGVAVYFKAPGNQLGDGATLTLGILTLVGVVIYCYFSLWSQAAVIKALAPGGEALNLKKAYSVSQSYIISLLVVAVLGGLAVLLGFILLIIPAIIVLLWIGQINYLVVLENLTGMAVFKANYRLVIGHSWSVLWRMICFGLLYGAAVVVLNILIVLIPGQNDVTRLFFGCLTGMFLSPFVLAYGYQLYSSLKRLPAKVSSAPSA